MHIHELDIVIAYVQTDLEERVYMEQPELFLRKGEEDKVITYKGKLRKSLYDLKQTGRDW